MKLIDDEGNLFGIVNVIDALVVLFILVTVAAGAAVVLQPDSTAESNEPDLTTTNVTLDLGVQPNYIAAAIDVGDRYSFSSNTQLTITDVYSSPRDNSTAIVLRATLRGPIAHNTLSYGGAPPRLGRTLTIQTETYQVQGTIRDVGGLGKLRTGNTSVLLRGIMPAEEAADLHIGEQIRSGGETVVTVENVSIYGTQDPDRRLVYLGLSLRTVNFEGAPHFGNMVVREGSSLSFRTNTSVFEGQVRRVGAAQMRGTPATQTVTLRMESVIPERANAVNAGMVTEFVGGETTARILAVNREPATVVLMSDGHIYQREHPIKRDITLTAELSIRQTTTGLTFKGRPIQQGTTVTLDFGNMTIRARVVSL